jgi:hypothetical protein
MDEIKLLYVQVNRNYLLLPILKRQDNGTTYANRNIIFQSNISSIYLFIYMPRDRDSWRALVNAVMKLQIP